jgi:tetratricopeptide (TPR) repeat protein
MSSVKKTGKHSDYFKFLHDIGIDKTWFLGVTASIVAAIVVYFFGKGWRIFKRPRDLGLKLQGSGMTWRDDLPDLRRRRRFVARKSHKHAQVVFTGRSGSGKSTAIASYYHSARHFDRRLWISWENAGAVLDDVREALRILGVPAPAETPPNVLLRQLAAQLTSRKRLLVVFDNANRASAIATLLPPKMRRSSSLVISSTDARVRQLGLPTYQFAELRSNSCVKFFQLVGQTQDPVVLQDLAGQVQLFPQAVRWIQLRLASGVSGSSLLKRFLEDGMASVLSEAEPLEIHQPILESFMATLEPLMEQAPLAIRILELLSLLADEPVPLQLPLKASGEEPEAFAAAIAALAQAELVSLPGDGLLKIHPFTLDLCRAVIGVNGRTTELRLLTSLRDLVPVEAWKSELWATVEGLRPHAEQLLASVSDAHACLTESRDVYRALGRYEWSTGSYVKSERLFIRGRRLAADVCKQAECAPADRIVYASLTSDLAIACSSLGRVATAAELHQDALARWSAEPDTSQSDLLFGHTGVSCVARDSGHYKRALSVVEEAITLYASSTADADEALWARSAQATAMADLGRVEEAMTIASQVLSQRFDRYGAMHLDTARSLYALARIDRYRGRFAESAIHASKCLEIRQSLLGDEHPLTLLAETALYVARYADGASARSIRAWRDSLARGQNSTSILVRARLRYFQERIYPADGSRETSGDLAVAALGHGAPSLGQYFDRSPLSAQTCHVL